MHFSQWFLDNVFVFISDVVWSFYIRIGSVADYSLLNVSQKC